MTAPSTPVASPQQRGARGEAWLRRTGGIAVTVAMIVLGLGAGLWLGSPASAATGSIQVDMGDGHFVSSTSRELLNVSALAPGGSVTGTMTVRDTSGNDGSHRGDTITLRALHVTYGDSCPLLRAECRAASRALGAQISFTVAADGPRGTGTSPSTLKSLGSRGAVIGTDMVDQDTLTVTVTATLDFDAVGNEVQYGSVAFDLALELTGSAGEPGNNGAAGVGDASAGPIGSGTVAPAVRPGAPEVAGEERQLAPDNAANRSGDADDDILVLGESTSSLPDTGVPVAPMFAIGGGALIAGLGLLWAARRRTA